jgi:hypothetical protein
MEFHGFTILVLRAGKELVRDGHRVVVEPDELSVRVPEGFVILLLFCLELGKRRREGSVSRLKLDPRYGRVEVDQVADIVVIVEIPDAITSERSTTLAIVVAVSVKCCIVV